MRPAVVVLAALALAGCRNSCQAICTQMKLYAEECGYSVPDSEYDQCVEEQSSPGAEAKFCRESGDPATLRNEWSCEDLEAYWTVETTAT